MIAIQSSPKQAARKRFALHEHPWLSLLAVMIATVTSLALSGALIYGMLGLSDVKPLPQFLQPMLFHVLAGFIIAPFILRLPKGKRTYREYLEDIGLGGGQPWLRLIALGVTCSLILALSQAAASVVYRLTEGLPVNATFLRRVFDLSSDLPPRSWGFFTSIPSAFEEVAFRGIVLTVFLSRYSKRTSIACSALGFGLIHLLNLAVGREPVWVLGQVVWAFILGLFYGTVFVRTGSLVPPMIVHYLGNAFIGSLTGYLQSRASVEVQTLYGVVLTLGIVPTTLMIPWTRFLASRWMPRTRRSVTPRMDAPLLQQA